MPGKTHRRTRRAHHSEHHHSAPTAAIPVPPAVPPIPLKPVIVPPPVPIEATSQPSTPKLKKSMTIKQWLCAMPAVPREYYKDFKELFDACEQAARSEDPQIGLSMYGYGIIQAAEILLTQKAQKGEKDTQLKVFLHAAAKVVRGPVYHEDGTNADVATLQYKDAVETFYKHIKEQRHIPWAKTFGALALGLIGSALLILSGIAAVMTAGLLAPPAFLASLFAAKTVATGIGIGMGALGFGAAAASGILFFNAATTSPIRQQSQELVAAAERAHLP